MGLQGSWQGGENVGKGARGVLPACSCQPVCSSILGRCGAFGGVVVMMVVVVVVVVVLLSAVVRPSAPHMRNEAPFDAWRSPLTGSNCQLSSNHRPVLEIAALSCE